MEFVFSTLRPTRYPAGGYINFGLLEGSSGYGLRDFAGQMQFKDSGGAWTSFVAGATVNYWQRVGSTVSPATAGDLIETSGGINITGAASYHAIGASRSNTIGLWLGGTGTTYGMYVTPAVLASVGATVYGVRVSPTITEAASGTHAIVCSLGVTPPSITGGAATVTNATTLFIAGPSAATVTGRNSAIQVDNGDIWVVNGAIHASALGAATPAISFNADQDTGIFNAGANILGFSAGGSQRATISNLVFNLFVPMGSSVGAGHALGIAGNTNYGFYLYPNVTIPSNDLVLGLAITGALTGYANQDIYGLYLAPAFTEAASGTHALLAGARFNAPTITTGAGLVTNAATVYIAGAPSATVSGANYAFWVDDGASRFDGDVILAGGLVSYGANDSGGAGYRLVRVPNV